ncbi:MAG TPA: aminotransferase class I/II-fold pyridoxal phosphate-dependent enzyme [Acidimicrobiales bacterium]|nr:aminotransferase class I/II-fold pyridoxal phosphate-dependent enzyme [Acidimicrobiales bacterium]
MSFTPPPYPYERLDGVREVAACHEGGAIDCSIGTPIDPPPDFVIEELARAAGARGYPTSAGSLPLREAAAAWLGRRFSVAADADHVAACVGTKEFVASLAHYLKLRDDTRDTVLYPAVSYPTYAMGATLAGLRAVAVPVAAGRLDLAAIDPTDARRALVLWSNSPSNPTGGLDDLAAVAEWGRENGVLVASDECYSDFTWAGPARSILEHGETGVLALHSVSKRSNLAGLRAGFYSGDRDVVSYLRSVRQHAGLMVAGPIQAAVALAYGDDEHVEVQRRRYHARLAVLSAALESAGVEAPMPDGGFYLWCRVPGLDGWQLAARLAEVAGLVVSPGEFYGDGGDNVRIAVVQSDERLELAASRLRDVPLR